MRAPIRLGSGEPILLLHPFLLSQSVWDTVAQQLADTGRYEVFAPTMAGHHGGHRGGPWLLDVAALADDVEQHLDAIGWRTAHIVGNSLGGWVAFELERRGRARTVTGIAPAGGWGRWQSTKFAVIGKFLAGLPAWLLALVVGTRVLRLPFSRQLASLPLSATPDGLTEPDLISCAEDFAHCPAYYRLLVKTLTEPGLLELANTAVPAHLVVCEKDRVFPPGRYSQFWVTHLPADSQVSVLDGVGHVPMLEAPGRITETITDFLDRRLSRPA